MRDEIQRFEDYLNEQVEDFSCIKVPYKMEVCHRCGGEGKHVNPSIDGNGITSSEMYELGGDFREDYFAGVYDVICEECNGRNVVRDIDRDSCSPAMLKEWDDWLQSKYELDRMYDMERRMGS